MNPAERLKRLRLELMSKKTTYSDKHPDVLKLEKEIKELEKQVGETGRYCCKVEAIE